MSNQDCRDMMNSLVANEEKRLNVNSQIFLKRHFEIMNEADRELLNDLRMEQQETA